MYVRGLYGAYNYYGHVRQVAKFIIVSVTAGGTGLYDALSPNFSGRLRHSRVEGRRLYPDVLHCEKQSRIWETISTPVH